MVDPNKRRHRKKVERPIEPDCEYDVIEITPEMLQAGTAAFYEWQGKARGEAMQVKFVYEVHFVEFERKINEALKALPSNAEVVDIKLSIAMAERPEREMRLPYNALYGALILWRENDAKGA